MRGALLFFSVVAVCAAQTYRMEAFAGAGAEGFAGDGSSAWRAQFARPSALALDSSGNLYIGDTGNNRIRRIDNAGTVTTFAADITAADLAVDRNGSLLAATGTQVLRITGAGEVSTFASGFENAAAIAVEPSGSVLVADGSAILRIAADGGGTSSVAASLPGTVLDIVLMPDGKVVFAASQGIYELGAEGAVLLPFSVPAASFTRLAVDRYGDLYTTSAHRVWKIAGGTTWTLAGVDEPGSSGDSAPAVAALLNTPAGLAVDAAGNIYLADSGNHRIRLLRAPVPPSISAISPGSGAPEIWPRNLILRWTPVFGVESWDVYFGTDPSSLAKAGTTSEAAFAVPSSLNEGVTYYWRVATRILPNSPQFSPVFSFRTTALQTQAPVQPLPLEPRNLATGLTTAVRFTWQGTGASRYDLYLDENQYTPKRVAMTQNLEARISGLKPYTQYFWRVVAVNDFGETRSELRHFTTAPEGGFPWLVETVAGTTLPVGDGAPASEAILTTPTHVTAGPNRAIYFVESGRTVRRIDADGKLQTVYTPQIGTVTGLAVDPQGNVYVASPDHVVRIQRSGTRAIVAGQPGRRGFSGDNDLATQALLDGVTSIAVDRRGFLYIADTANNRIRVVAASGRIRTFAGTGECSATEPGGNATATSLCRPFRVAADTGEEVFIASGNAVYRVALDGVLALAVNQPATGGLAVNLDGTVLVFDASLGLLYRAARGAEAERIAGEQSPDGQPFGFAGDGLPADRARFAFPDGVAFDASGNILIADTFNARLRQIDTQGFVSTIAGSDTARGDRGRSTSAFLFGPTDVAVDAAGTVYVADSLNNRIRRVSAFRTIDTFAGGAPAPTDPIGGSGRIGRNGRDLSLSLLTGGFVDLDAQGSLLFNDSRFALAQPGGTEAILAADTNGNVTRSLDSRVRQIGGMARGRGGEIYVSDVLGHRILRLDADGTESVVAGTGAPGFAGDGALATVAQVHTPRALSMSPDGELYVAEFGRVRRITFDGRIETVLNEHANGLAHDRSGTLYMSTSRNIFLVSAEGVPTRIAGRETASGLNDGGPALDSRILDPRGLTVSADGEVYFADAGLHLVRRLIQNAPASLTIASGNNQTAVLNERPPEPLRVRVTGRTGQPVAGVVVNFSVTSGTVAPISFGNPRTDRDGYAQFHSALGQRTGRITMRASVPGLDPVEFVVTVP